MAELSKCGDEWLDVVGFWGPAVDNESKHCLLAKVIYTRR